MPRSNTIRFRMPPIEGLTQDQDQDEDPRATYRWCHRAVKLGYFSSVITGIYSQRYRAATHKTSLGADIALIVAFVLGAWTLQASIGLGCYGSIFEPEFPRR
ncbi:hypothetical protein SORBI_3008G159500 [Sorghum bicolor]|uniref:Uncharacterized protein n=1 Tax=Sorghum bicolor TaxID=4558 RepID=A0A1B6PE12_SORBI|nr:hypothetical protein SORBI_3008G159500 [Sorghum bicolor]